MRRHPNQDSKNTFEHTRVLKNQRRNPTVAGQRLLGAPRNRSQAVQRPRDYRSRVLDSPLYVEGFFRGQNTETAPNAAGMDLRVVCSRQLQDVFPYLHLFMSRFGNRIRFTAKPLRNNYEVRKVGDPSPGLNRHPKKELLCPKLPSSSGMPAQVPRRNDLLTLQLEERRLPSLPSCRAHEVLWAFKKQGMVLVLG